MRGCQAWTTPHPRPGGAGTPLWVLPDASFGDRRRSIRIVTIGAGLRGQKLLEFLPDGLWLEKREWFHF